MTTVKIYDDDKKRHIGFELNGHAMYAKSGEDIVCAAISMLVTNSINSLELLAKAKYSYEENELRGHMKFMLINEPDHDTELLLSSMILGLSELEKNYPKNIRLIIEEVQSC